MYEMLVRKGVWEGKRSGNLGMDGNKILKLILVGGEGRRLHISGTSQGPVTDCCKHGRKSTGPTDGREYFFSCGAAVQRIISYHISYHILYHIIYIINHIISYHVSYHISYHVSYHIIQIYHITSHHIVSYRIIYHISYHISYIVSYIISYRIIYHFM